MATWTCDKCGYQKDARCKPRQCPQCGSADSFKKKEQ